jgi:hypothetical protein
MAVGFILASCQYHILDSQFVTEFEVDFDLAIEGAVRIEQAGE